MKNDSYSKALNKKKGAWDDSSRDPKMAKKMKRHSVQGGQNIH